MCLRRFQDTASIMSYGMAWAGSAPGPVSLRSWLESIYNFTDDKSPQPFIPIVVNWNDYIKVLWVLPHVYDYMEGRNVVSFDCPLLSGTYNRRHYLTAYGKKQKAEFDGILADRDGGNTDSIVTMRG